jgi:hypothetical protein
MSHWSLVTADISKNWTPRSFPKWQIFGVPVAPRFYQSYLRPPSTKNNTPTSWYGYPLVVLFSCHLDTHALEYVLFLLLRVFVPSFTVQTQVIGCPNICSGVHKVGIKTVDSMLSIPISVPSANWIETSLLSDTAPCYTFGKHYHANIPT